MKEYKMIQSRVHANNPDDAAIKIRKKHNEYKGNLHIKLVFGDWYEYTLKLTS